MKCTFQLLDKANGQRSPAVTCTREEFAEKLADLIPESEHADALVIVLVEHHGDSWHWSQAPIMSLASFVNHFATVKE